MHPNKQKRPASPSVLIEKSRILDLLARPRHHSVTVHSSTFKEGGTGSESALFEDFKTLLHDVR